ncbi:MAG: hypothetical protein ACRDRU_15060, partial [Pseudonocardiaceae bacterium]
EPSLTHPHQATEHPNPVNLTMPRAGNPAMADLRDSRLHEPDALLRQGSATQGPRLGSATIFA